jgi:hypothetical protein
VLPTFVVGILMMIALVRLAGAVGRWHPPRGKPVASDGEEVSVCIDRGKRKAVDRVSISIDMPGSLRFAIRRENRIDRFFKRLGVAREPQTRDESFDDRLYVECEDTALLRALESSPALRQRFDELVNSGKAGPVFCAKGRLWAYSRGYEAQRKLSDGELAALIVRDLHPALIAMRDELRQQVPGGGAETGAGTPGIRRRFTLAILACFLAGGLGFVYQWFHVDYQVARYTILRASVWTTAAVGTGFLVALFTALRGTSITHDVLLDILLAAVPTSWLATTSGFLFINQTFDPGPPRSVIIPIATTYSTGQKDTDYYLEVPRWPDEHGMRKVELRRREFELVQQRSCVNVLWREGRLGDGWVQEYRLPAPADCQPGVEK